jgi:formate--tetrahydrofolate ligase
MQPIKQIAKKLGIKSRDLVLFGDYIAKVNPELAKQRQKTGKLILVTAMTPTKFGEGKTTTAIGLADALSQLNKKTALCLREPSLGPLFSQKGGATGGGRARVEPSEDINLHFTGDIHAITSAHNLLAAYIDNYIYWGDKYEIDEVYWLRAIDLCDRTLRKKFLITAASEVMAVFCLARNETDLKKRLANIVVAHNKKDKPVKAGDLGIVDNLVLLLKKALWPNLVQTQTGTPTFVHGGPFANIAHGTNSIIATRTALSLADWVVTEAGFGADLGAFKFFDIVARFNRLKINGVVIVATLRAIKIHGLDNVVKHCDIIRRLGIEPIVALNVFAADSQTQIKRILKSLAQRGIRASASRVFSQGARGAKQLAQLVVENIGNQPQIKYVYKLSDSLEVKINKVATDILGAKKVEFSPQAQAKIKRFRLWGYDNLPICLAKTQYSLSDDKTKTGVPKDFTLKVTDVSLSAGAGFVVVYCGPILTMPGMPKP